MAQIIPVLDLRSRKVEITSQNHNFAVGYSRRQQIQKNLEPRNILRPLRVESANHTPKFE